jgi:hypothetical protein
MECRHKGPERRVLSGGIIKDKLIQAGVRVGRMRRTLKRVDNLVDISNNRYTTVSKELIDRYEKKFGVAKPFNRSHIQDPETYFKSFDKSFENPEDYYRSLKHGKDVKDKNYRPSNSEYYRKPLKPTDKDIKNLKSKEKASPIQHIPAPSKEQWVSKTIIQQTCYTYYNKETLEHINSLEPLDPNKHEEKYKEPWERIRSIVDIPRFVPSKQVLIPLEKSCWIYFNTKTGDQRVSFKKLEKADGEMEFCESVVVPQFDEYPERLPIEAGLKAIDLQEDIDKEIQRIEKENREFATEEEILQESQCLEDVKEMGVQAAIKYIKEESKNDDNLKAYICHELSLKSPRHSGNVISKKRSATKRLQDWIQYNKYPSMTLEQAEKLVVMLNSGSKVLVDGDKISVRGNDLITLKKRGWLNDEVINFYVELILKRAASEPEKYPKIHMFNTFFYPLLEKKGYPGVARITKKAKVDIFSLDMVIVPIHLQIHWALAVINIKERRLEYYDSMSKGYNDTVLSLLRHYVEEEYKDKKKASSYDMSEWKNYRVENLPQQTNAYDCGVFAMTFAEHISRGVSVLFVPPKHMKYFRLKMMWEIINSKLLPVDQQHSVKVQPDGILSPVVRSNGINNGINKHINSFGQKRTFETII